MALTTDAPGEMSDDQLLAAVKQQVASERGATVALVRLLMELDARRLYLGEGFSSLFTYCTQALHLADGSAYNRIEAARAARRFPEILDGLEDGSLTLTAVRLLSPHLTVDNHRDLLAAARYKRKRDVELIVATLAPQRAAAAVVRRVPEKAVAVFVPPPSVAHPSSIASALLASLPPSEAAALAASAPRNTVTPIAPERYRIHLTISGGTYETLQRVRGLLRHVIPTGDPVAILDRALTLLLADLERNRFAATSSPRPSPARTGETRHIPAAVRRHVWARDEGRCAFIGTSGRCTETAFLEFHHIEPYAAGGKATRDNIQLRCRAHNAYEATLFHGDNGNGNDIVREHGPAWPRAPHDAGVVPPNADTETAKRKRRVAKAPAGRKPDSAPVAGVNCTSRPGDRKRVTTRQPLPAPSAITRSMPPRPRCDPYPRRASSAPQSAASLARGVVRNPP